MPPLISCRKTCYVGTETDYGPRPAGVVLRSFGSRNGTRLSKSENISLFNVSLFCRSPSIVAFP